MAKYNQIELRCQSVFTHLVILYIIGDDMLKLLVISLVRTPRFIRLGSVVPFTATTPQVRFTRRVEGVEKAIEKRQTFISSFFYHDFDLAVAQDHHLSRRLTFGDDFVYLGLGEISGRRGDDGFGASPNDKQHPQKNECPNTHPSIPLQISDPRLQPSICNLKHVQDQDQCHATQIATRNFRL